MENPSALRYRETNDSFIRFAHCFTPLIPPISSRFASPRYFCVPVTFANQISFPVALPRQPLSWIRPHKTAGKALMTLCANTHKHAWKNPNTNTTRDRGSVCYGESGYGVYGTTLVHGPGRGQRSASLAGNRCYNSYRERTPGWTEFTGNHCKRNLVLGTCNICFIEYLVIIQRNLN